MTIEEGIEFFEDIAMLEYDLVDSYHTDEGVYGREESYHREKAEHHEQVAIWLKELQAHREAWKKVLHLIETEDEYYECERWCRKPCDEDYFFGLDRAAMIIEENMPKEGENE